MGSLKFAGTTADYARGGAPAVASPPMTIAALVRPRIAPAGTVCIGGMMDASAFNDAYLLRFTATPQFRLTVRDSSDLHINATSTVTAGEWGWGVARITSTSSAESIWQGDFANKGSSATAKTVTGANIDRLSWGKRDSSANDQPFDGMINAAVVWNVALTDDEITALNQGIHPAMIRPASIVHLWDRMGQTGTARDIVGDNNLTVVGATVDDETPKRLPVTVSVGGSPFAVTQRLLRMRVSNADVWSTAAELAFPSRPFTFSGIHDATANEITLTLDDGTTQTISLAGSNDQDGDLVIGAGLDAGAVVDETTNGLGISAVTVSTKVPTSEDDERAQTQHAEWLAPSVTNTSASLDPASSVDVDLSSSVDDKGQGWSVVAVSSSTGLVTPSILSGTTVRITSQDSGSPSGSDTVTCSIRNNNPRPMTRFLDIAVTVGVGTFINGYSYEKTLLASRLDVVSGTLSGVVVRLAMTDAALADTGNGGNVESSDGYDIRFELEDQTKLSHHVRSYDNTTGALDVNIRIPTWSPSSESVPIRMFYGNASVTSAEQSVTGVWGDFLAVWDCRTGEDFSGNGRNLTPSNITTGTLLGDAGDYNGSTSVGVLTDPSWLSGLAAITISGWIKADAGAIGTDKGIISQGIISGPDDNMGIDIRFDGTTFNASPVQTNTFTLQFQTQGGGRPRAEFFSGLQTTDEQYFAAQFEIADIPKLFLDGEFKTPAFATTDVDPLPLQVPEGSLYLGAGPKDSASGGWAGLIDEIRIAGDAMPPAWLPVEYLTELRRVTWFGISSENTPGATRYPVAASIYEKTGEGDALDIDVVTPSNDPEGGSLSISAVGSPSNGTAADIGSGSIRYTPAASFVGDDSFTYTLTNGDKADTGTVYMSVTGIGGGTGFETSTGLWNAEAYSDLPAQFQDAVMIYANDTGGATQSRLDFLNNTEDSGGPGPWGEGVPVYKYRRLEMRDSASARAARDGRPSVRHKVRLSNEFGVPDTVHDLKLMMPQRSGFLQASENSPIQIDFGEFNCIILRWHMWADAWRANQDGGKRVQMLVGLGNRGAGNKPLTATETFGSTKGIGFNTQAPYISGDRMGLGSLVNHETNPNNSTWLGFGETENTNKRAHALNRWIAVDQIFRRNDAGQSNGFWRVHTENSHFDVVRNNVKFCDNPTAQLKSISFELRMMHGGNPVKNEPGDYNKPVNDYNEDLGGFFLFKGNWVG